MLIVLTAEIAAGVWSLQNGNKFETFVRSNVKHSISQEYGVLPSRTVAIDGFQSHVSEYLFCFKVDIVMKRTYIV